MVTVPDSTYCPSNYTSADYDTTELVRMCDAFLYINSLAPNGTNGVELLPFLERIWTMLESFLLSPYGSGI